MATIYVCNSHAEASLHLNEQIARRYGPAASIDDFELKIFDVPHEGSALKGKALVACPKGQIPGNDNICIAYWGDTPRHQED